MRAIPTRLATGFVIAIAAMLTACGEVPPTIEPVTNSPNPELTPRAIRLTVDMRRNTVTAVSPSASAGGQFSLIGNDVVNVVTSNMTTTAINGGRNLVKIDVAITNNFPGSILTTPTFPVPPANTNGILLFPFDYNIVGRGVVRPSTDWDGAPHNFFNDLRCNGGSDDCFRYETFAGDLRAGQTTAARSVGFEVEKDVTSFTVLMIVAADMKPIPPPQLGRAAGRATNSSTGQGIAAVIIDVANSEARTATDANGNYQLPPLVVGTHTMLISNVPSLCTAPGPIEVIVTANATTQTDFIVPCILPAGDITGVVHSPQRGPQSGVVVTAGPVSTMTDSEGRYNLTGVPAGPITVSLTGLSDVCTNPGPKNTTIVSGGMVTLDFAVECTPAVGNIAGQITGTFRGPLAGVVVFATPTIGATTDANGNFNLGNVPVGPAQLTFANVPSGCTAPSASVVVLENQTTLANVQFSCTALIVDADADGFNSNVDCNDANPAIHPGAMDKPDGLLIDSNCDNIDGDVAVAIFVATTGTDAGSCGTRIAPCRSISAGIAQAGALSKRDVYVGIGSYNEIVHMRSQVNVYGAYAADLASRSLSNTTTIDAPQSGIEVQPGVNEPVAVMFDAILTAEIADFEIRGAHANGPLPGGHVRNSYAVLLRNSSNILITRNRIIAGNGAHGLSGTTGASASQLFAPPGSNGANGDEFVTACNDTSRGAGGIAGSNPIAASTAGGNGGAGGTMDTDCSVFADLDSQPGRAGLNALTTTLSFGVGGVGGPTDCSAGAHGSNGFFSDGSNGTGGTSWDVIGGLLRGLNGSSGGLGAHGGGGGGGGGAAGCDSGTDAYGAGGGGGGAGGERAPGAGTPGIAGGSSMAIASINSTSEVSHNIITLGNGGVGGGGGDGGRGQPGGQGGSGGFTPDGGKGGNGGTGGRGGHGGGGGGGAGGHAIGIWGSGVTNVGNSFLGGLPGTGGPGGLRADGLRAGAGPGGTLSQTRAN